MIYNYKYVNELMDKYFNNNKYVNELMDKYFDNCY